MLEAVDSIELQVEGLVVFEQRVVRAGTEVFLPRLSGQYATDAHDEIQRIVTYVEELYSNSKIDGYFYSYKKQHDMILYNF